MNRLEKLRALMKQNNLQAGLFYKPENRFYISGFRGSSGYALITQDKQYLITDFRYTIQARAQCPGFEVIETSEQRNLYAILGENVQERLGFEDDFMSVEFYNLLSSKIEAELVPMRHMISALRILKDPEEVDAIQKAQDIADQCFDYLLTYIKPGMTEKQVYHELLAKMRELGAENESFQAIVASGVRGALPHGIASDKVIEQGDLLTLDFGCISEKYCSDMTRTICVGKASKEQKKIYDTVLKAQQAALQAIKPGLSCKALDSIARDIITEAGYGPHFGHSLGHGVGIEVHEGPRIAQMSTDTLEAGMIITDEPGIYIEDFGGVRIEDIILVTEDGYKVLSKSPKQLIELDV